jgi:hypothetical protein
VTGPDQESPPSVDVFTSKPCVVSEESVTAEEVYAIPSGPMATRASNA